VKPSAASFLTGAGVVVAVAGVTGLATGVQFSLPPAILTVVIYKGIFAAAAGLMIVGALFGRQAYRHRSVERQPEPNEEVVIGLRPLTTGSVLGGQNQGSREAERVNQPGDT
jgi:hypothetical protein